MTYCVAVKIKDGLVALADGRVQTGAQTAGGQKISHYGEGKYRFFIMTAGLRSIRDKTLSYFDREIQKRKSAQFPTLMDALNLYISCQRRVAEEDKELLEAARQSFDYHSIIGGIMPEDTAPRLYLVYPEGNWIEVDEAAPYLTIGAIGYGKPILDRVLRFHTDMKTALKLLYLSFDSTKFSNPDVGFPINFVTYSNKDEGWRDTHLQDDDVRELRLWWNQSLTALVHTAPESDWMPDLLGES